MNILCNKLDFGCGNRKKNGMTGIDFNSTTDADVVHDLNVFPYPFEDNSFEEIHCSHILEHLPDLISVMRELYRISKPGAKIFVEAPYWSSHRAFKDPTHIRFFTDNTFDYFSEEYSMNFYSDVRIKVLSVKLEVSSNSLAKFMNLIFPITFLKLFNNLIANIYYILEVEK